MSSPEFSIDPAAKKFMARATATFSDSAEEDWLVGVDNSPSQPNHKTMTDLTRQEVDAKLAHNKAELEARLANFDTSIKTGFADMRTDMAKMQSEMHKNTSDLIKWGVVTALGFATATVAILTFVINNAVPKAPPAAVTQQAPTILAVPPGTTVLSAPQAPAAPPAKQSN